jgi:hypothetical protein
VYAHVEIVKYYEHRAGDFAVAIQYTQRAIQLMEKRNLPELERLHWVSEGVLLRIFVSFSGGKNLTLSLCHPERSEGVLL